VRSVGCIKSVSLVRLSAERRYRPRPEAVGCMPKLRGPHFNELAFRARRWDGQAILSQTVDVELDGFADQPQDFLASLAHRHASRQIRGMCSPAGVAPLDYHHVAHHRHAYFSLLRPACFSIAFKVPGGTSKLGLPATVTVPGLLACLYCRWLPRVRASRQPSPSSRRISSPTFKSVPMPSAMPCNGPAQRRAERVR